MFSEEKLSQAGRKYWCKNCISKLLIKIFTKKAVKTYAYRRLLSFKMSVTYKKCFNFMSDNCVCYEPALIGHNLIFCRVIDLQRLPVIK